MFTRLDSAGKVEIRKIQIDFSNDEVITEQNHKGSVDINEIVAKHGIDRIAQNQNLLAMQFDDNPYNNFQEMMEMVAKGKTAFESLPAKTRSEFENNPAKYLDYINNPANREAMIERGWLAPPEPTPEPVEVIVTNVTPPIEETPPA